MYHLPNIKTQNEKTGVKYFDSTNTLLMLQKQI